MEWGPGSELGRIRAWDEDPVIYNAKLTTALIGPRKDAFTLDRVRPASRALPGQLEERGPRCRMGG